MDFLVKRDDLHECRLDDAPRPVIEDGQALLEVSHFGLTSNNITYAMFGVAMNYWDFFPAPDGWGRVPTWGFATVTESRAGQLEPGVRVYGYLPPSSELVVQPARVNEHGFIDGSPHRAALPAAYNSYRATASDPVYEVEREEQQMLLRPLFFTSYLLDDFLAEAELFGADTAVISSASSKTSSALAHLLSRRGGTTVVGLTSERSADFVKGLGVYDHVVSYGDAGQLPAGRAVYVDMAGDAAVRQAVHEHYGDELTHSAVIGATHHDKLGGVPDELPGPRPTFFFAPDRVAKRIGDWGAQGLEAKLAEAWHPYVAWTDGWLEIDRGEGGEALESAYLALLDGHIDAARADVLSLPR
jgi:NADPH:quinone reductase-like Zn-dependent oxidoreductase